MHIVILCNSKIPALNYGGTERVIWALGKALASYGHLVSYIVHQNSYCPFAKIIPYQNKPLQELIPRDADLLHSQFIVGTSLDIPNLTTIHGNHAPGYVLPQNSVFVSRNHANRHDSDTFVYNGLDFEEFGKPDLHRQRKGYHFLAKAAWRVKNVRGAIDIVRKAHEPLAVLGGYRLNFKMGFRFTPYSSIRFHGMVGTDKKQHLLERSKGLLFPVVWHEPFGLALIESLYFGCPVFGTPYGSLPELISADIGFLSDKKSKIVEAMTSQKFEPEICHQYASTKFNSMVMAEKYLSLYKKVLNGERLNPQPPQLKETEGPKFLPLYD